MWLDDQALGEDTEFSFGHTEFVGVCRSPEDALKVRSSSLGLKDFVPSDIGSDPGNIISFRAEMDANNG